MLAIRIICVNQKTQNVAFLVVNLCRTNVSGVNKGLAIQNCGISYIYSRAAFYIFEELLNIHCLI